MSREEEKVQSEVSIGCKTRKDAEALALLLFRAGYAPYLTASEGNREVAFTISKYDIVRLRRNDHGSDY